MTTHEYEQFCAVRTRFHRDILRLCEGAAGLDAAQKKLIGDRYVLQTPVVYNSDLDGITQNDTVRLILVADNPGRQEQCADTRRYLVGPAGKLAESFFTKTAVLGITKFRAEVLVLNKTPIHTANTGDLGELKKNFGAAIEAVLKRSQEAMVQAISAFADVFPRVPVWIVGYSEMRSKGIFEPFTICYGRQDKLLEKTFVFQHFSRSCFTTDLKKKRYSSESTADALQRIGKTYREKIWGIGR